MVDGDETPQYLRSVARDPGIGLFVELEAAMTTSCSRQSPYRVTCRHELTSGILDSIAHGSTTGFSIVYDAVAPDVFAFIIARCETRAQAEAAMVEVWLQVWRNAPTWRHSPQSFRQALLLLASDVCSRQGLGAA